MANESSRDPEDLIEAILRKLRANKDILGRSMESGTIEWDWTRNQQLRIRLRPRL